jgi:hypothetical protein
MDYTTFNTRLNALVSEYLENSGDPSLCAETLRDIADVVFEDWEEDGPDPGVLWNDTSAELG